MTYVLGLNAYHADAAACLVKDGDLVAAVEEERFRRIKHWGGFPSESIRYCLDEAGISLADVSHVAVNSDNARQPLAQARLCPDLGRQPGLRAEAPAPSRRSRRRRRQPASARCPTRSSAAPCTPSSIISAISPRPSSSRPTTRRWRCRSTASAISPRRPGAWAQGGKLAVDGRVYFPHSLGVFYEAMTQFIGFPHYGDEYKVMGLAPYGEPRLRRRDEARSCGSRTTAPSRSTCATSAMPRARAPNYSVKDGIPSGGRLWSDALDRAAGPGARSGGAARGPASRHRALGAGDLRERLLQSAGRAAQALRAPTRSCWPAAAPTTRSPTARCSSARRSRRSTSSRPAAMPAARSARPSRPGTRSRATRPSATS